MDTLAAAANADTRDRSPGPGPFDLLAALPYGVALFDAGGSLARCNEAFREVYGTIADLLSPGVPWEVVLRALARRGVDRHAIGDENAWVARHLRATDALQSFEIETVDGRVIGNDVSALYAGGFVVSVEDRTALRSAEARARESDELLSTILERSPANLVMARVASGEIIVQSRAAAALFGSSVTTREYFANAFEYADFLTELLPTGEVSDFAASAHNAAGTRFPALFSARIFDYHGDDVMVLSVVDLTEQTRARQALSDAHTRLRDAVEALDEGFALYDRDCRIVLWNSRYLELNAPVAHALRVGVTFAELSEVALRSGTLGPSARRHAQDAIANGPHSVPSEFELEYLDGSTIVSARHPTSDGGFVITRYDVTERKRAARLEREADERLRQVVDVCPVNLIMVDAQTGEVAYVSRHAAENFGTHPRFWQYLADPAQGRALSRHLASGVTADERVMVLRAADGAEVPAALASRKIEQHGRAMWVSHAYDLRERIAMERELSHQKDLLHQSEKLSALGELLAGVAHELNNPLTVVIGHALMLRDGAAGDAAVRAAKISTAAERCSKIVKTFLAMARQRPARPERMSLNAAIQVALEVAGYGLRQRGADIALALDPDLPDVMGDVDHITQVVANLIVNAEHAMGATATPRLVVTTRSIGNARGDARALVEARIEDNGPGIPPALRARIFEPFFTTKQVGEGTGIGLAFSYRVIEAHGGVLAAGSSASGGAAFTIRLAAAPPRDPERVT